VPAADSVAPGRMNEEARERLERGVSAFLGDPTRKDPLPGAHRSRPPEETWRSIQPLLSRFGITRVADVTGLDRVGIPVWMAVRPNSLSLSVMQGQGIEPMAARVSAAMKGIEMAHGEVVSRELRLDCYEHLARSAPVVDVASLPPLNRSLFSPKLDLPWVEARDLATGQAAWVPYEMVHTDATVPWKLGSGCFLAGTSGLASGNTLAEAVLHGLCEAIERDAMSLWAHAPVAAQAASRVDLSTVKDPTVREVLERFAAAGLVVVAWDITSDVGLPAYRVSVFDHEREAALAPLGGAVGAGCHLDPAEALLHALTEAAQSRLTRIVGARDDLTRARYRSTQVQQALAFHQAHAGEPGVVPVRPSPAPIVPEEPKTPTTPVNTVEAGDVALIADDVDAVWAVDLEGTVDGDVVEVLAGLAGAGLKRALVVDLSLPGVPVSVARVIVPGLEGPMEASGYLPGRRARARAGSESAG